MRELSDLSTSSGSNLDLEIIAHGRSEEKMKESLTMTKGITLATCDLGRDDDLKELLSDLQPDAALWCAAGFTDSPSTSPVGKVVAALKLKFFPTQSIDITALETLGEYFSRKEKLPPPQKVVESSEDSKEDVPSSTRTKEALDLGVRVVMCSSAGVTRPTWDEEKKEKFKGR